MTYNYIIDIMEKIMKNYYLLYLFQLQYLLVLKLFQLTKISLQTQMQISRLLGHLVLTIQNQTLKFLKATKIGLMLHYQQKLSSTIKRLILSSNHQLTTSLITQGAQLKLVLINSHQVLTIQQHCHLTLI